MTKLKYNNKNFPCYLGLNLRRYRLKKFKLYNKSYHKKKNN